jgi:hypothetical protein
MASKSASKQAKAQNEATQAQQRAASASAQRERIKAIREARMAAGGISNVGAGMGMGQASSGIAGSLASIGSQAGSNIANINVQEGFAEMASQAHQRAANAAATGAQWQAIGQVGSMVMNWGAKGTGGTGSLWGADNKILPPAGPK